MLEESGHAPEVLPKDGPVLVSRERQWPDGVLVVRTGLGAVRISAYRVLVLANHAADSLLAARALGLEVSFAPWAPPSLDRSEEGERLMHPTEARGVPRALRSLRHGS